MNSELSKGSYSEIFEEVRQRFNNWDPMGLISLGAPADEYSAYIEKVLSWLNQGMNKEDIALNLENYFRKMFSDDSPNLEKCQCFSGEIKDWWDSL